MKRISDSRLPAVFQQWIEKAAPISPDVYFFPRTIDVSGDIITFISMCITFGTMPVLLFVIMVEEWVSLSSSLSALLFISAIAIGCASVPLLLLWRAWGTLRANSDKKHGVLRQGIFIGDEGLLVRMTPNWNYPIYWDEFVAARLYPPMESSDSRKPLLILTTKRGDVSFFAERLTVGPSEIHAAACKARPDWKPQRLRANKRRELREDFLTQSQFMRAVAYFVGAMLLIFFSLGIVVLLGESSPYVDMLGLFVVIGIALVIVSSANLAYRVIRIARYYKCPQCGAPLPRYEQALPDIHYYCAACNIEWDTGANENEID